MPKLRSKTKDNLLKKGLPWALALVGTIFAFHPALFSGFARMQTDPGDTRLVHYILEHGFRWVRGWAPDQSFFDAPFFYPAKNVLAYSEVLIGSAPIYWFLRTLGVSPDPAFVLWTISCLLLNFWTMRLFLTRGVGMRDPGASLGAFLFAYGAPRLQQIGHQQLLANFYLPLVALGACKLFAPDVRKRGWIALIFVASALQLLAGFYQGWFLTIGLLCSGAWALTDPRLRTSLMNVLRQHWRWILFCACVSVALVAPVLSHYWKAAQVVGTRNISQVMEPNLQSWLYMGDGSWLYSWQERIRMFQVIREPEQRIGVGLLTFSLSIIGLFSGVKWRTSGTNPLASSGRRVLAGAVITLFVCMTSFFHKIYLWPWLFHLIPGANAIRSLSRVGLLMLLPLGYGFGRWVNSAFEKRRFSHLSLIGICALGVLEQGRSSPSFEIAHFRKRVANLVSAVKPGACQSFYMPTLPTTDGEPFLVTQIDAMWASFELGIPTINGYSGNTPPGWQSFRPEEPQLEKAQSAWLKTWTASTGLAVESVCWLGSDH